MSCEYGYHCKQCDVDSETWINHGKEILSMYVHFWPVIQLMYNISNGYLEVEIMGYRWLTDKMYVFLEQHYEHGIEIVNEYGDREPVKVIKQEKPEPPSPFIGQD